MEEAYSLIDSTANTEEPTPVAAAPSGEQEQQEQQDQQQEQQDQEDLVNPELTVDDPPAPPPHETERPPIDSTPTAPAAAPLKSKKRNRETAQGGGNSNSGTPAALQASLQQIHQTLLSPNHFSLPAFQALVQSYLVPHHKQSINVPHFLRNNMLSSLASLAQKHLNDVPPYVHLNTKDAAPQLVIDGEKLTVKGGMRGYRMVRGSQGVEAGGWYYEVEVLHPPSVQEVIESLPENVRLGEGVREGFRRGLEREEKKKVQQQQQQEHAEGEDANRRNPEEEQVTHKKKKRRSVELDGEDNGGGIEIDGVQQYSIGGHLRIGWSMRTGELQAPVGYDRWSYGIRDIQGSRIHNSKREDKWGGVGFRPGDVVGFAIHLVDHKEDNQGPTTTTTTTTSATTSTSTTKKNPTFMAQSNHIRFFKNGAPMGDFIVSRGIKTGGEAFDNIESGTYYPALSSYMGGTAKVNFGPYFIYPPKGLPTGMKLQPMSDTCPKPRAPQDVLDLFKKEKCILKKVEEAITNAIYDAVYLEAEMRYETYQKHLADHIEFVRRGRMDRGLSTSDLPEPLLPVVPVVPPPPSPPPQQPSLSSNEDDNHEDVTKETKAETETETVDKPGETTGTETVQLDTVVNAVAN